MKQYPKMNFINEKPFMSEDSITQVANMINTCGKNRKQRRRLEKSLGRTETILRYTQKHVDDSAYKEYQRAVDENFIHFYSTLGLLMVEDYKWKEDENHNQVESLFRRLDKKLEYYDSKGLTTKDIVQLLEEKTGICLVKKGG